jgi:hypothetical protein
VPSPDTLETGDELNLKRSGRSPTERGLEHPAGFFNDLFVVEVA